jgi:hypothetical protein
MTADAHAGALDAGLDAAIQFYDSAPTTSTLSFADKVFGNVVEKAFGARASTQLKGKSLLFKIMEVDTPSSCTLFLLSKLADKKPKIPPMCLETIREAILLFGARSFPIKELIKAFPPVLNGSSGPAREGCMSLMVELHRWIGAPPFVSLLESLRSAQKTEFETLVAEKAAQPGAETPPVPSLYIRKERPSAEDIAAAAAAASSGASAVGPKKAGGAIAGGGMDSREFVEDVDLSKKLQKTEYATLIAEEKWSEQLKGLQCVIDAIGPVPKIKAGTDVHDVVAVCKGFLRQVIIQYDDRLSLTNIYQL